MDSFIYWTETAGHGRSAFTTVRYLTPAGGSSGEWTVRVVQVARCVIDGPILGQRQVVNPTTGESGVSV